MTNTLIIYYSLDGNSKFVAKTLAKELKADLLEIKVEKLKKHSKIGKLFWGGMQVVMKKKPEIVFVKKDFSKYKNLIFGTPVWVGTYASPFNTFFNEFSFNKKNVVLFCCYDGSESNTFKNFKKVLKGNKFMGELGLKKTLKNKSDSLKAIKEFSKKLISLKY